MATTPVNLPSINIPFVDQRGRLSPIWHEFLRSFVTGAVDGTIVDPGVAPQVVAGNGLVGGGPISSDIPLRVGQGAGIAVNADDVSVDIVNQTSATLTLDDEIVFADVSDNNLIRKTKIRGISRLNAPGGLNTQVQYNNNDVFDGNSGFTYNGTDAITVDDVTINGTTFTASANAGTSPFLFRVPAGSAQNHFTFTQSGSGSSAMPVSMEGLESTVDLILENNASAGVSTLSQSTISYRNKNSTKWTMGLNSQTAGFPFVFGTTALNAGVVYTIDATNRYFTHSTSMMRSVVAAITASTTQTQGQGALTADINVIATCANANDTVTLPVAVAGRFCLVINNGAQTLKVFPASGDDLGAGVDASTTIVTTSRKWFVAFDATNWEPVL